MPSYPACPSPQPDETAVELVAVDGGFASGLYLPLNDVRLGRRADVQTVLNGNLALSWAESTFSGFVDDTAQHVERFDAGIDLSGG